MATIYRYEVSMIDENAVDVDHDTGFVAADSFSKAVEEIESYVGGNEVLVSVSIYEVDNPMSDATVDAIFEDIEGKTYTF